MSNNIWLKALMKAYRFQYNGLISTEDLFDLNLNELDDIYRKLDIELDKVNGKSLMDDNNSEADLIKEKLEVVEAVFKIKKMDAEIRAKRIENNEKKQKILKILNDKQDEALSSKSTGELQEMLDELN